MPTPEISLAALGLDREDAGNGGAGIPDKSYLELGQRISRLGVKIDAECARIVESVEDALERQEPDFDPNVKWAGGDWRVGRSGCHRSRIYDKALKMLPPDVVQAAERHWAREDDEA